METKIVAMRMPTALHAQVTALACQEHRNVTQTILWLVEKGLALQAPVQSGATSHPSGSDDCAAPEVAAEPAGQPACVAQQ